ncbi:MAG TPA: DUF1572 family protein [Blastocatellia bacterium]|nr:DUF1572 family protein [Blastocatellia bacterium]
MTDSLAQHYLDDSIEQFRKLKVMADKAIAQVDDRELFFAPDPESNSIAVIIKHISGNQRSRWTDFLTSDGEKPNRHRDTEFEIDETTTRETVLEWWEGGWKCLFDALEPLRPEDLMRTVTIRGLPHTVVMAINRQLTHYASHVGQIVFLAKQLKAGDWKTLSIPRGQSEIVNQKMMGGGQSQQRA